MSSVPFLEQAAVQGYQQQKAQNDALKQQQRAQTAALYLNAVQTPLPKDTLPDGSHNPAYDEALASRENALKGYLSYLGPEQHATFANRLHGLITGHLSGGQDQNAAQAVASPSPAPTPGQPAAAAQNPSGPQATSTHPFAHNPVYAKILEGLNGLGKHLSAAAHPLPPQAGPDIALLASAQTPEARKNAFTEAQQKEREVAAIKLAEARYKPVLKAFKLPNGNVQWLDANNPAAIPPGATAVVPGQTPHDSQAALAVYIRAKFGPNPTWEQIAQGTREHQALMAGITVGEHQQLVFDDQGKPHVITLHSSSRKNFGASPTAAPPKSNQAPALASINQRIHAANASSKKLNKGKPKSSQAPVLGFTKGNPIVKADATQYTKVAEDANNKQEAYDSARKALASGSTASSDQELIYSWVRANVQGAGRMTQAEFRQAASIGSLPQRAQIAWQRTLTGKLPPEMEQMFLADIKRASETAQQEADTLRQRLQGGPPVSSQAPQVPGSTAFDWNKLPQ